MGKKTHQLGELIPPKAIKISMVFSFRNEEDVLPELISRVRNVLKLGMDKGIVSSHELIFICGYFRKFQGWPLQIGC